MLTQVGEFVELNDGRTGHVIFEDFDRDSGYSYIVEVEKGVEVFVRSAAIVAEVNPE